MSIQEEIHYGVKEIVRGGKDNSWHTAYTTDQILKYLDSKGVVRKLEKPKPFYFKGVVAGHIDFERLIEE